METLKLEYVFIQIRGKGIGRMLIAYSKSGLC